MTWQSVKEEDKNRTKNEPAVGAASALSTNAPVYTDYIIIIATKKKRSSFVISSRAR